LDVRGNGGGNIIAGERLLQVLTPNPIEAERFYFLSSRLTLQICEKSSEFARWKESIDQSVETGTEFSNGFTLRPAQRYNDIGQKYQGPVVLLTDARCYSTTDIFSAGFQDHQIGKILGTSARTGAGGANVWTHEFLRTVLSGADSPFQPLPANASFRVAVRRSTRVGVRSGELVEDLGVTPDDVHRPTRDDVLSNNVDLINRAGEMLAEMPAFSVRGQIKRTKSGTQLILKSANVSRVDLLRDQRTLRTLDVQDGTTNLELTDPEKVAGVLELRGFQNGRLVASDRVTLP
ncbi:MAG: peptidase S41, partial [Planctomycetaceae bacterium]